MEIVHLTDPSGRTVTLMKSQIVELREPLTREMHPQAKTVVITVNGFQAVRETIAQVEAAMR